MLLMIDSKPRVLELPLGVKTEVRPLTTAVAEAAVNEARKRAAMAMGEADAAAAAGQPLDPLAWNAANSSALSGLTRQFHIEALARFGIIRWEGLDGGNGALPLTPAAFEAFAAHPVLGPKFYDEYYGTLNSAVAEGNGSTTSSNTDIEGVAKTAEAAQPDLADTASTETASDVGDAPSS